MTYLPTERQSNDHIVQLLVQRLRDSAISGTVCTYQEMLSLTGLDVRTSKYRYYLNRARAIALKDYGINFKTIRGSGLKPLSAGEAISAIGVDARSKIRNETDRWRTKFDATPKNDFQSQEELSTYLAEGLRLRAQEEWNGQAGNQRVAAAVEATVYEDPLSPKKMKQILLKATERLGHIG